MNTKQTQTIVFPHAGNPQHVENLSSVSLLAAQGFDGMDASLAESLFCYGLVWRELDNGEILFVYRHPSIEGRFDRCTLAKNTDAKREWNWVKWADVCSFTGTTEDEWQAQELPYKVYGLISYYGTDEIFGSSYWEGFAIEA